MLALVSNGVSRNGDACDGLTPQSREGICQARKTRPISASAEKSVSRNRVPFRAAEAVRIVFPAACRWINNRPQSKRQHERRCDGQTVRPEAALADGRADLVAFGKPFIANPDLVERLRNGLDLNVPDKATFYGGGAKGYIDYPNAA